MKEDMTDLKVPYAERLQAIRLGACWSKERKTWYAPSGMSLTPFEKWLTSARAADFLLWRAAKDAADAEGASARAAGRAARELAGAPTHAPANATLSTGRLPWE